MKSCYNCKVERDDAEFLTKYGRQRKLCIKCARTASEISKRYQDKHDVVAKVRQWRIENPDKLMELRKTECAHEKLRRKENPDRYKLRDQKTDLKRKYGLTVEQYDDMVKSQNGVCAICKQPPGKKRLAVDHCHKTGKNRELLCSPCNTALHKMEQEIEWADAARNYLLKHSVG